MLNPLAIGYSLGGQLLNIITHGPQPQSGDAPEFSLLSPRDASKVLSVQEVHQEFGG